MSDIFLSSLSEDRERVRPLATALEKQGFSVWWEDSTVPGESLEKKLSEARSVVVVWRRISVFLGDMLSLAINGGTP